MIVTCYHGHLIDTYFAQDSQTPEKQRLPRNLNRPLCATAQSLALSGRKQTVPRAELKAMIQFLLFLLTTKWEGGEIKIHTDNKAVWMGSTTGKTRGIRHNEMSDLWDLFWEVSDTATTLLQPIFLQSTRKHGRPLCVPKRKTFEFV